VWNKPIYKKDRFCNWCSSFRVEEGGIWLLKNNGRNKTWKCGECRKTREQYLKDRSDKLKKEFFGEGGA
tara:strand:- start:2939 stop:3145 length:207 start_codon:yes stop_codon:yes gene_type:complete